MSLLRYGVGPDSCPDKVPFHRFLSEELGIIRHGYSAEDARAMTLYLHDAVESQRVMGHKAVGWAGPCNCYKDETDRGCAKCRDEYMAFRKADAALQAECFAKGVLARQSEGDRLLLVTLAQPMVAVRGDRLNEYRDNRQAARNKLSKRKRKARKDYQKRKKKRMLRERGIVQGPEYMTKQRVRERELALKKWVSENADDYYQLQCMKADITRAIVESADVFMDRVAQGTGFKYVDNSVRSEEAIKGRLGPDVKRVKPQRVKPPGLRWLYKQFEMRVRQFGREHGFGIKYIAVIELGKKGGFHFHILLHVFPTVPGGSFPDDAVLEEAFRKMWFEVSGNIQFESEEEVTREDGTRVRVKKSWFSRVLTAEQAAAYVSKYIGKGWFSRRQTSKFLNLKDAARDARLVKYGFLDADISANFVRDEDANFLSYKSPLSDLSREDIENLGCTEWVGLSLPPQAPLPTRGASGRISLPDVKVVAVFSASAPCRHPASALSGICVNPEGEVLEFVPSCWWFPKDRLIGYLNGIRDTEQVRKFHDVITKSKFRAIQKAHAAVLKSASTGLAGASTGVAGPRSISFVGFEAENPPVVRGSGSAPIRRSVRFVSDDSPLTESEQLQFRNLKSIFTDGGFALQRQFNRLQKSVDGLLDVVTRVAGLLSAAQDAEFAREYVARLPSSKKEKELDARATWFKLSGRMRDRLRTRDSDISDFKQLQLLLDKPGRVDVQSAGALTAWEIRKLRKRFDAAREAVRKHEGLFPDEYENL